MIDLLLLMFSAVLIENFIFSRFLGICPFLGVSSKPNTALGMGCAVIFVMSISSAVTYLIYTYLLVPFELEYFKTIAFIFIIAAIVQFIEMFLRKFVPSLYNALGIYLPLITTNCAVLGAALLNIQKGHNFIYSVTFGFSSAVGFTLAIVIFAGVRVRVALADPPRCFKGIPITLVTAGLLALAFSGFAGMSF
ncbi:MAG: electron transport complex subunit RsxA [Eubacteriales bacterium]|nr:electron transport complex subunit RsxA [Eubacteriales bacterium]